MTKQNSQQITDLKEELESYNLLLIDISSQIMKAGNSTVHKLDFYFLSIINRTISLNKAFSLLLENNNSLTGIFIARLQLDNLIRLYATKVVDDGLDFLEHFFDEKPINTYKVKNQKLTDKFLVTELDKENPGCLNLYNYLCDFVHFSYRHFDATKDNSENENAIFKIVVGDFEILNDNQRITLYENMCSISHVILKLSKELNITKNTLLK